MGKVTWRMSMPDDSTAWLDLLEYGRKLGMQPAETTRVIIVEWSEARRGRMVLSGMPFMGALPPTPVPAQSLEKSAQPNERERAKARGARFAGTLDLDE